MFMLQVARCKKCNNLVKPDIVFFGESLPARFFNSSGPDTRACDLLIIMGTSLVVYPFASLQNHVGDRCPRLLVNREKVGNLEFGEGNVRNALFLGECDDGVSQLAELLGWAADLQALQSGQPVSQEAVGVSDSTATAEE